MLRVHRDCLRESDIPASNAIKGSVFYDDSLCPRCDNRLFDYIGAATLRGGVVILHTPPAAGTGREGV